MDLPCSRLKDRRLLQWTSNSGRATRISCAETQHKDRKNEKFERKEQAWEKMNIEDCENTEEKKEKEDMSERKRTRECVL